MAELHVSGAGPDRTVPLTKDVVCIGSATTCDLILPDGGVSSEHCEISRRAKGWRVVDLESRDGTRLNGSYVNQGDLTDGDVLEVGGVKLVFKASVAGVEFDAGTSAEDAARFETPKGGRRAGSGAAAAPQPKKAVKRRAGARAAKARRDDAAEEPAEPEGRAERQRRTRGQRRKAADTTTTILITGGVVVVLAFVGYLALDPSGSPNRELYARMVAVEREMDWDRVVELSKEADPNAEDFDRIEALAEKARTAKEREGSKDLLKEVEKASMAIRMWRQGNWKEDVEYVARIDTFLDKYGKVGGSVVGYLRTERAKFSSGGDLASRAGSASAAWRETKATIADLEKSGRYGEALDQVGIFWKKWGGKAATLLAERNALIKRLNQDAKRWMGSRISRAQQLHENGDPYKARKILKKAAETIGIPDLEDKAAEAAAALGK